LFEVEITIQNVVLIGSFNEPVDLMDANVNLDGSKCKWRRFPGLSYKLKVPPATFLLFRNGKFVCTGIKSEAKGKEALVTFLSMLKTKGLVSNDCTFECCVKNLVASVNINGASASLEEFTKQFERAIYEQLKNYLKHQPTEKEFLNYVETLETDLPSWLQTKTLDIQT